jgi:hypothetical protein
LDFAFHPLCNSSCFSLNYWMQRVHFTVTTNRTSFRTLQNAVLYCLYVPIPHYSLYCQTEFMTTGSLFYHNTMYNRFVTQTACICHHICSDHDGDRWNALHYGFFYSPLQQISAITSLPKQSTWRLLFSGMCSLTDIYLLLENILPPSCGWNGQTKQTHTLQTSANIFSLSNESVVTFRTSLLRNNNSVPDVLD